MERKIVIGTRGSELALKQAEIVASALRAADASVEVTVRTIVTQGDTNQGPIPLDTIGKGWFTKEIEDALRGGTIDVAVHSLKDLTESMPEGLILAAYLPREDARDVLVTKRGESLEQLPHGAVIGTDSMRRQAQMLALRPDATMRSLRGNVPTRLKKLHEEPYDAIIVAAAGLKRLGREGEIIRYFTPNEITPAPGQGILAVQAKDQAGPLMELLVKINNLDAARAAAIERSFARRVEAGCKSPVGAYAFRDGDECRVIGMLASEDHTKIVRGAMAAPWDDCGEIGEALADTLIEKLKG